LYICTVKTKEFINFKKPKKEMKKVLLVLAVAGLFVACGKKQATATATETPEATPAQTETVATATETPADQAAPATDKKAAAQKQAPKTK
jgi:uncharacterized lipoprotein YajG